MNELLIKVSVIIPVYNAEKYLPVCINSLLNQTLKECEFIFINDGSRDRSSEIIKQYKETDSRIKLINQDNAGVSIARNKGLKLTSGEFVGFVDADDSVEHNFFEKLYHAAKIDNCDIVFSNFESEIAGCKVITKYPFIMDKILQKEYIKHKIITYMIEKDDLNTACNKLFKNKLIKDNSIEFPAGVALGEDGVFNLYSVSNANSIKYIDYTGYHYKETVNSATRNIAAKDYFQRALDVYHLQLPKEITRYIDSEKVKVKKAIKLINSVMSYIHIYFAPTKNLSFFKRFCYVKNMISNTYVEEALQIYFNNRYNSLGRYEKFLLKLINKQSALGLYIITSYSRYRNKTYGGSLK